MFTRVLIPLPWKTTKTEAHREMGEAGRKPKICNKFKFYSRTSVSHPIQSSHSFAHLKIRNELNLSRA